jgi:hypothetical protein
MTSMENKTILEWEVHLARKYPWKTIISLIIIAYVGLLGYYIVSTICGIAAALIIGLYISDFLLPVKYKITSEKATSKSILFSHEVEWTKVVRCTKDRMGVKLSSVKKGSVLESFRGVYLRYNENNEDVDRIIDQKC